MHPSLVSVPRAIVRFAFAASAVALVSCGGGDSAGPSAVPASISQSGSAQFSGTVGSVLSPTPTFVVKDASGNVIGGVPITVAVTSGSSTLTNAPTSTSASGPTSLGTITLGHTAGPTVITISVNGLAPLTITVTGIAGPPTSIALDQGFVASTLAGTSF